jgi:hypothetical protein
MELPSGPLEIQVDVRRTHIRDGSATLGLSFIPGQERTVGALAVAVFHADVARRGRGRRRGSLVWEGVAA